MHILAFILMFVIGAIIAACDGDYSGIAEDGIFIVFLYSYPQYYGDLWYHIREIF